MTFEKLYARSTISELILPINSKTEVISIDTLHALEKSICDKTVLTLEEWLNSCKLVTSLDDTLVKYVYHICEDFYNRKGTIYSWMLVIVLFLQNVNCKRKRRLGDDKKLSTEDKSIQYLQSNLATIVEMFKHERLVKVLELLFSKEKNTSLNYEHTEFSQTPIVPDNHGMLFCIQHGKKLVWRLGNDKTQGSAKMATTAHLPSSSGRKKIVLCNLSYQTLIKSSSTVSGSSILLHRCNQSQIYLPTNIRNIDITKCRNCVIVTGPVKKTVRVTGCSNVTVVTLAKRVIIEDCVDCKFYIFTATNPLLSSSCHGLVFAPFNVNYEGLQQDLRIVCLDKEKLSYWDKPVVLSMDNKYSPTEIFTILDPAQFRKLNFPVNLDLPGFLLEPPANYGTAEDELLTQDDWEKEVDNICLSPHKKQLLQRFVNDEFMKYTKTYYQSLNCNIINLVD